MLVSEVMTKEPICCPELSTIRTAARLMNEADTGVLPVVNDRRQLVGVITDRDLCVEFLAEGRDAAQVHVFECMTLNPGYCMPDADVRQVLALMAKQQVRRIPVVDNHGKVQGIITIADLIQHDAVSPRDIYMALKRIMTPKASAQVPAQTAA